MKGQDSFASTELMMGQSGGIKGSTRNYPFELRKVLGIFSWTEMSTHEFRFVQMLNGNCHLDYIEFMPTNLIGFAFRRCGRGFPYGLYGQV